MKNETMKVFISEGYGKGSIVTKPIPEVNDEMVLVKICYCGICGTDQDLFSSQCSFTENGQVTYPLRPGHEWAGIVEKVGSKVTAFKKGDKVVGDNGVACGECSACKSGDFFGCKQLLCVGTINPVYDGAFAEYFIIPERHLHKIPEGLSLKEATLAEPLSVAYGGIKKMNITSDSVVVVIGTGCIALSAVVLAKLRGAKKVITIGRNSKKLEVAKKLGSDIINIKECDAVKEIMKITNGKGADFVLECSGASGTFKQALEISAYRAVVAMIGFYETKEQDINVDLIVSKSLTLFGVMGEFDNMPGVLKLLEANHPDMTPIITDELPFDDCINGFVRKNYPNAVKITVKINAEE